ncbi:hypothetical protein COCC4DRAFT_34921 [Bipolaris maydis ATCC 48331]|uniref:Uncharacterized protein n=2 Tax=Cochliobolus heterostrophus TaxID=5016 RepID=M2V1C3_COCH5|nr:uncharacterized protein COCC4DRAFT_34921 [Bipolaris maydis ATCC 48331]EMD93747.1 hypothetical protein COCHEDRAFT_1020642 [Bipolaris maydis C5]EMD96984.1 hypothetical protein COCHEDRAFT_1018667 [Bipolaris maydis C5]ENH99323.1 hypothetical protein COCC4DRAFT_34921 [Bipolaris maydis ATCC 48331]
MKALVARNWEFRSLRLRTCYWKSSLHDSVTTQNTSPQHATRNTRLKMDKSHLAVYHILARELHRQRGLLDSMAHFTTAP